MFTVLHTCQCIIPTRDHQIFLSARNCTGFTITHGEVVSAGPERKMQVRCDEGYQLVGRLMTCLAGRARSGDIPACSRECLVLSYMFVWVDVVLLLAAG